VDAQAAAGLVRPFQTVTGAPCFRPDPPARSHKPSIALLQRACRTGFPHEQARRCAARKLLFGGSGIIGEVFEACQQIPIGPCGNRRAGRLLCGLRLTQPECLYKTGVFNEAAAAHGG
jgi:hypothetical protein